MLLYALTIFAGAFLLFQIQPIIAKAILPWFGGAASVWTTCLLFFQVLLSAGYLYAHALVRYLRPRGQALLHVALLSASLAALPIGLAANSKSAGAEDPSLRILSLLAATIGLPYFLLSTTGPLMQAWLARARPGVLPYRLYALSNAGSMLALLSYPVGVEPFLGTTQQMRVWSVAYTLFAVLSGGAALGAARARAAEPAHTVEIETEDAPNWGVRTLWVALAAVASILLLAVTNHLTKDVAPVPFLWVLPLTLYLISLILCFEREGWYQRRWYLKMLIVAIAGMVFGLSGFGVVSDLQTVVLLFAGGLFVCCMVCHGELALLKPPARYLTEFYLLVSIGGALGGVFVALLAPRLFRGYFELPIGMFACAWLALVVRFRGTAPRLAPLVGGLALAGATYIVTQTGAFAIRSRLMARNFYGVLRVSDFDTGSPSGRRRLTHGTINHGEQYLAANRRREPTTYYGPRSGVRLAILASRREGSQRIGVAGLGAGVLAAFGRAGDYYRFYEINPLAIQLASTEFSFLKDCPAQVEIVLGDARLSLEREPPQAFDVLAIDAFSGDAMPVHLMTEEALALYFRHLKDDGILVLHVSNRYLHLSPVVEATARALGKRTMVINAPADFSDNHMWLRSIWVLATASEEVFERPALRQAADPPSLARDIRPWTDNYSNLLQVLR